MKEAFQPTTKSCDLFLYCHYTMDAGFGLNGLHKIEAVEK